jgi:hypothetical protein
MAQSKTKTFESNHEGPIAVAIPGTASSIYFTPGEVRTHETDDPAEIAALEANPDISEVKSSSSKSSKK